MWISRRFPKQMRICSVTDRIMSHCQALVSDKAGKGAFSVRLFKEFPQPVGTLLDGLHLECDRGEIIALLGISGCGKTTILNLIAGLLQPDRNSGMEDDQSLSDENPPLVGYAFQHPELLPWRDCEGNAYHEAEVFGEPYAASRKRVEELLRVTRLSAYRSLYPAELSVGMRQRLQLVRVVSCPRPVLLLDEPLGAVDQPMKLRIAEAVRRMTKEDCVACVWVTHDSLEAVTVADTVLVLGGRPLKVLDTHSVARSAVGTAAVAASSSLPPTSLDAQAASLRMKLLETALPADTPATSGHTSARGYSSIRHRWRVTSLAVPLVPVLLLLLGWEFLVLLKPELRFYLSSPSEWIPLLVSGLWSGGLLEHLRITLTEAGAGLAIGGSVGVLAGFGAAHSDRVSASVRPSLIGMSAIPLFVLAPAFILWFGIGISMKIAIATLSAFPFIAYMTHDSARQAKGLYYRYLSLGKTRRHRLFTTVVVPGTLEGIIESLRPAAVAALIGAFLGEFIAANAGLGYYIILQASRYHVAEVFAGVSLLFLVALIVDWATRAAAHNRHRIILFGSRIFRKLGGTQP